MDYRDYYQVLNVQRDATNDDIRKAYRRLARKYHPDISQEPGAETRFKEITEAYEVLKDDEKRRAYDQLGSNWQAGQRFEPPPGWNSRFNFSGDINSIGGFSDFFESLFGGAGFKAAQGFDSGPTHTQDADRAELNVSLEQIFEAQPIEVEFNLQSRTAVGRPQTKTKRLKVKIPPGLNDGESLRLKGQGSFGRDLLLKLKVEPHKQFTLDGRNTSCVVSLKPWEAALGATIEVPTLGGSVNIKLPAGTDINRRMRLKNRGLPGGHHYVSFRIEIPKDLSDREKKLYSELAEASTFNPRTRS